MHLPTQSVTRHDFVDQPESAERVLVVVFLRGGADALTLVPPLADDRYHKVRPVLRVKPSDAIDLDGYFALNATLRPLMKHYEDGRLAFVHGAGSEDDSRSHFEAQDTMEHGGREVVGGWIGRYLRARAPGLGALSAVAIGTTRPESLRGAPVGAVMQSVREFSLARDDDDTMDRLARLYAVERGPLQLAARDTIAAVRKLRELRERDDVPGHGAAYPRTSFGRGLREIARLIKADVGLVATTIDLDGWDTHFVQATLIGRLMDNLARGIDAFLTDLGDERKRVTLVAMTEFGRRLRENSSFGTDHGAGSLMMLFGEDVEDAGRVKSSWRDLSPTNLDEVGDIPSTRDYRSVIAPILMRHRPGLDIARVFPGMI